MPPESPSLPAAPSRPHRIATPRWRNVAVFLAAVAGVHLAIDGLRPPEDLGKVSEKFAYFARHKDQYDAVFVGSSHVYGQISPKDFDDQVSAATGRPVRSFNLGVPSMFLPESLFVIDRIVAQRPARLRWMFIELDYPLPRLEEHAGLVQREVYWHGWRETMLTCANVLTAPGLHRHDRVSMLAHQLTLFGRCWAHLGSASEWLATRKVSNVRSASAEATMLGPVNDGYNPYHGTLGQGKSPTKDPVADTRTFLDATAALRSGAARAQSPAPSGVLRWVLSGKIRAWRARGIEPVFIIPPVTTAEQEFLTMHARGDLPTLFAFNDPAAYPELYQVSVHADTSHLNATGAELFTHLLAAKFAAYRGSETPSAAASP